MARIATVATDPHVVMAIFPAAEPIKIAIGIPVSTTDTAVKTPGAPAAAPEMDTAAAPYPKT